MEYHIMIREREKKSRIVRIGGGYFYGASRGATQVIKAEDFDPLGEARHVAHRRTSYTPPNPTMVGFSHATRFRLEQSIRDEWVPLKILSGEDMELSGVDEYKLDGTTYKVSSRYNDDEDRVEIRLLDYETEVEEDAESRSALKPFKIYREVLEMYQESIRVEQDLAWERDRAEQRGIIGRIKHWYKRR